MTERPEGAPGAPPDEPETDAAAAHDPERDAAELEADEAELEAELEAEGAEADGAEEAEPEGETVAPLGVEPAAPPSAATGAAVPRRRVPPPPSVQRAPTQSELAVRVTDNTSRVFVIGTVVIFVSILLWGLIGGTGGFLTTTPAPTAAPTVSVAPSVSASPS
jgi:hypothetical protein